MEQLEVPSFMNWTSVDIHYFCSWHYWHPGFLIKPADFPQLRNIFSQISWIDMLNNVILNSIISVISHPTYSYWLKELSSNILLGFWSSLWSGFSATIFLQFSLIQWNIFPLRHKNTCITLLRKTCHLFFIVYRIEDEWLCQYMTFISSNISKLILIRLVFQTSLLFRFPERFMLWHDNILWIFFCSYATFNVDIHFCYNTHHEYLFLHLSCKGDWACWI